MAPQPRGFSVVDDLPQIPEAAPPQNAAVQSPRLQQVAVEMLKIGIATLSQRFVVALASLFTLLTVGSAFFLWWLTPDPTQNQIVSLTIYAVFVLAANYLNMRRK